MPRKPDFLNIRQHLEHIALVIECYEKYGDCPAFRHELKVASLVNKAIIRKHDKQKAEGNRKDLYMPTKKGNKS